MKPQDEQDAINKTFHKIIKIRIKWNVYVMLLLPLTQTRHVLFVCQYLILLLSTIISVVVDYVYLGILTPYKNIAVTGNDMPSIFQRRIQS